MSYSSGVALAVSAGLTVACFTGLIASCVGADGADTLVVSLMLGLLTFVLVAFLAGIRDDDQE